MDQQLFEIASQADQDRLSKTSRANGTDLTVYKSQLGSLRGTVNGEGFSQWMKIKLATGKTAKQVKRPFNAAASAVSIHIGWHKDSFTTEYPEVGWFRVKPAPKARKNKNGAAAKK